MIAINPKQIRAARVLLDMHQKKLAEKAGLSLYEIQKIEKHGAARSTGQKVQRVVDVLSALGVEFIPPDRKRGFGVRRSY